MFGRRIVEFLHKRTRQIWSLLTFGELASGGFFHYCESTKLSTFSGDREWLHKGKCKSNYMYSTLWRSLHVASPTCIYHEIDYKVHTCMTQVTFDIN
jgi:hypothetical protein